VQGTVQRRAHRARRCRTHRQTNALGYLYQITSHWKMAGNTAQGSAVQGTVPGTQCRAQCRVGHSAGHSDRTHSVGHSGAGHSAQCATTYIRKPMKRNNCIRYPATVNWLGTQCRAHSAGLTVQGTPRGAQCSAWHTVQAVAAHTSKLVLTNVNEPVGLPVCSLAWLG
jgi:hypothetical protein